MTFQSDDDHANDLIDAAASEAVADPSRRPTLYSVGGLERPDVLVDWNRVL